MLNVTRFVKRAVHSGAWLMKCNEISMNERATAMQIPNIELPYPNEHVDFEAVFSDPEIDPSAWVAPNAIVLGRVKIGAKASVWYNCVLRGDGERIEIGDETNIQDGSILHIDFGWPCILGKRVTLGHNAIVHGSVVQDGALIGIAATVLSRCTIGEGALIAAGAVVLEGTQVPPHTLWTGCPAKQVKELNPAQRERLGMTYRHYVNNAVVFRARYGK